MASEDVPDDVVTLAHSAEKVLQILTPWSRMINTSESIVCKEMGTQAHVYAKAIYFSIEAAHQGSAACEDVLTLVEYIQTTTAERREFLEGPVKEITKKGLTNAREARDTFIHVRRIVEVLLGKMKIEDQDAKLKYDNGFYFIPKPFSEVQGQLTKGIQDLEEFSNVLTKFVAWWNELGMETSTQLSREDGMSKRNFNKLHFQTVERKWKDHRNRYAAYVNELSIVQDRYPKLFAEFMSSSNPSEELDVAILASSINEALELLAFWIQIINASESIYRKEIHSQALIYVQTVDFSVEAAHQGSVVCAEALTLMECVQNTTAEKKIGSIENLKAVTQKGLANAAQARNRFIHTHSTWEALVERMETEDPAVNLKYDRAFRRLLFLDLKELSNTLTKFANWWEQLEKEIITRLRRQNALGKRNFHQHHLQTVVERMWKLHRSFYGAYVNEIDIVRDRYNIDDDSSAPSIATRYSKAPSSIVTDYGFYYIRHALNSSESVDSLWSHGGHDTFTQL